MLFWGVFILIILILVGDYKVNGKKLPHNIYWLYIIILIFFSAIRFDIGYDYPTYWKMVSNLSTRQEEFFYLEPTIRGIIYVARYTGYPPLLFFIYAIATYGGIGYIFWRQSKGLLLSTVIYISLFYLPTIGFIRQGVALSVILYSYSYILHHKPIKFIICILIATLFHYMAFIAIVSYPLYNIKKRYIITLLLILYILGNSFISIMSNVFPIFGYLSYIEKLNGLTGGNIVKYVFAVIILVSYFFANKSGQKNMCKMVLISGLGAVFPFILGGHIGGRIGWFFLIFLCLTIPEILSKFRLIYVRLSILFFVAIFMGTIYISTLSEKSQYTPYVTIFDIDIKSPKFK